MKNKEIGGFFGFEFNEQKNMPQQGGILLNSCRNALLYILNSLRPKIRKIYIPYYTCHSVENTLKKLKIPFENYFINNSLEILQQPDLNEGEFIIANNYFGIKDTYINDLATHYSDSLISDMAQALYAKNTIFSYYSMRKFVGVADGGVAYLPRNCPQFEVAETDESWQESLYLLKRWDVGASSSYADCKASGQILVKKALKKISNLTLALLNSIDFDKIKNIRNANYQIIHKALGFQNELILPTSGFVCPMTYPLLLPNGSIVKQELIKRKIYIPTYWPHITGRLFPNNFEHYLATNLIPIPIDQRYNEVDMAYIINTINSL